MHLDIVLLELDKALQATDEYKPFDENWLKKYDHPYSCALMGWEFGDEVFQDDSFILKQEFSNLHIIGVEFRGLYEIPKLSDIEIGWCD